MLFNKPVSRRKSNSVIVFNIFIGMFVLIHYIHAVTMALIFLKHGLWANPADAGISPDRESRKPAPSFNMAGLQ